MTRQKSPRQIRADRMREAKAQDRAREAEELVRGALRLQTMRTNFSKADSSTKSKPSSVLTPKPFRRETPDYPSNTALPPSGIRQLPALPEHMQVREAEAQKEIKAKKRRVAVLYNKGGYQYVSDETDLTTLGSK